MSAKRLLAVIAVESLLILGLGFALWGALRVQTATTLPKTDGEHAVHLHADLRLVLNGQAFDFQEEKYLERSDAVHFHEESVPIVHVETDGVTWGEFFRSLGMTLTKTCLTLDTQEAFCTGEGKEFRAHVNGVRVDDLSAMPIADLQRVLVFFGAPEEKTLQAELGKVTADACVQSGNCFGRDEEEAKAAELESGCTGTEPCRE